MFPLTWLAVEFTFWNVIYPFCFFKYLLIMYLNCSNQGEVFPLNRLLYFTLRAHRCDKRDKWKQSPLYDSCDGTMEDPKQEIKSLLFFPCLSVFSANPSSNKEPAWLAVRLINAILAIKAGRGGWLSLSFSPTSFSLSGRKFMVNNGAVSFTHPPLQNKGWVVSIYEVSPMWKCAGWIDNWQGIQWLVCALQTLVHF